MKTKSGMFDFKHIVCIWPVNVSHMYRKSKRQNTANQHRRAQSYPSKSSYLFFKQTEKKKKPRNASIYQGES